MPQGAFLWLHSADAGADAEALAEALAEARPRAMELKARGGAGTAGATADTVEAALAEAAQLALLLFGWPLIPLKPGRAGSVLVDGRAESTALPPRALQVARRSALRLPIGEV